MKADLTRAELFALLASLPVVPKRTTRARQHRLSGINLSGLSLVGLDLSRLDLCWANFRGSDLRGADFSYSALNDSVFDDVDLTLADLSFSLAHGASFKRAKLVDCHADGLQAERSNWSGARIGGSWNDVTLWEAKFHRSILLPGISLHDARFGSDDRNAWKGARAAGVDFSSCILLDGDVPLPFPSAPKRKK